MVKRFCAAVLVAAMLMSVPAAAASTTIWGVGWTDCGEWLELRKGDHFYDQVHWIQGFISSYNWYHSYDDVIGDVSVEALYAYIDKYCRENPLDVLPRAAVAFINRDQ